MEKEIDNMEIRVTIYVISGVLAIVSNCIIAIVVLSDRSLKKKMFLHFFLAIAHAVNGISYLVSGIGYFGVLRKNYHAVTITPWECLTTKPWPIIAIFAGELPVITHFLISLELSIATFRPAIYRRYWRPHYKLMFGILPWVISAASLLSAFYSAAKSTARGEVTYELCHLFDACGDIFGTGHMLGMAFMYCLSSIMAFSVFMKAVRMKATNQIDNRRHAVVTALNFFAFFLIAVPYIMIVLHGWELIPLSFSLESFLYSSYIYTSVINLPVYIAFRRDFRQQLLKVALIRKNDGRISINTSGFTQTRVVQVKAACSGSQ